MTGDVNHVGRPLYMNAPDAAAVMGLPERTVRGLVIGGRVRAYRCGTQPLQVSLDDLEDAVREAAHLVPPSGRRTSVD